MTTAQPRATELLEAWREGDARAMHLVLASHQDWLHTQVRSFMPEALRARAESMDIVQESVAELWEHAPRFTIPNGKAFRGLLLVIARNTVKMLCRRWSAHCRDLARERRLPSATSLDLSADGSAPEQRAIAAENAALVRFALRLLDPTEQEIITMRQFEDLDFAAIGVKSGITADAARMRYNRAMARLRDQSGMLRRGRVEELVARESVDDDS